MAVSAQVFCIKALLTPAPAALTVKKLTPALASTAVAYIRTLVAVSAFKK